MFFAIKASATTVAICTEHVETANVNEEKLRGVKDALLWRTRSGPVPNDRTLDKRSSGWPATAALYKQSLPSLQSRLNPIESLLQHLNRFNSDQFKLYTFFCQRRQKNDCDCGVFVMILAERLAFKQSLKFTLSIVSHWRRQAYNYMHSIVVITAVANRWESQPLKKTSPLQDGWTAVPKAESKVSDIRTWAKPEVIKGTTAQTSAHEHEEECEAPPAMIASCTDIDSSGGRHGARIEVRWLPPLGVHVTHPYCHISPCL
uniref:ULP_PROTEASE domain-containing protein n=1 Tax=Steinernema glaseri TaxID=37863 RepID=A0A1I7ZUU4_9BILA